MPDRPNIVLMISHDLGCHIGPYGWAVDSSPNLGRLAAQSKRFDSHFATSPGCSQSRASLVTGRYPHANGQFGLAHLGWKLNEDEQLLPALLRNGGYNTTLIGIWHLHAWTLSAFSTTSTDVSTIDSSPEGFAEVAGPRAALWLAQQGRQQQPFYLHVGFWEVHRPFCGSESQQESADAIPMATLRIPPYLPNTEPARQEFAELHQSVALVDQAVDQVVTALDQNGLSDSTIVLFTADHGLPFPRAKGTLYDPGIQVALLARWPGVIAPGSVSKQLTSNIDIAPTLLDAANIPVPSRMQGQSLLDQVRDQPGELRDAVYAEKTYHEHYDPIRCIRTDRFKLIRNFANRPQLVLPSDIYNSPTRCSMTDDESIWGSRPAEELYDLANDPGEQRNLALDLNYTQVREDLNQRLTDWMRSTSDPLLNGPVPRP